MKKTYGLYLILGLILGASFGGFFGPAIENTPLATALGALGGTFLGWFIAAIVSEHSQDKPKTNDQ